MPSLESTITNIVQQDQPGSASYNNQREMMAMDRPRIENSKMKRDDAIRLAVTMSLIMPKMQGVVAITGVGDNSRSHDISLEVAQAIVDANQEHKVLIIDANFKQPQLHSNFNIPITPGLQGVLRSQNSIDEALLFSGVPGLYLLPAGVDKNQYSLQALKHNLTTLLSTLKESFDTILLNTPDISISDDPGFFAAQSNSVIIVMRPGVVSKPQLREFSARISSSGSNLLGVILTC